MTISDEEKRQIMNELARGNPDLPEEEPILNLSQDDENVEAKDYQDFDDFAQRFPRNEQRQLFSQLPEHINGKALFNKRANYN